MIPSNLNELDDLEIARLLSPLTGEEKRVVRLRFGLGENRVPVTLEGASQSLGVTREVVRQTELRAMRKLGWLASSL